MWQSRIEIKHYSIAYFNRVAAFKGYSAKFPLRVGLVCAVLTFQVFMHLCCVYESRP